MAGTSTADYWQQPRFIIRYIGRTIDDARTLDGIWYCISDRKIVQLLFQSEVRVCFPYDARCSESTDGPNPSRTSAIHSTDSTMSNGYDDESHGTDECRRIASEAPKIGAANHPVREASLNVSATTEAGELVIIPRGTRLNFNRDVRDCNRVLVGWDNRPVTISRTAWDACRPVIV